MIILALGAIGYISAGFMGIAIGVLIGVVVEFVWKLIKG
jgi:tetrahydromethanopterin S-methyltransferase subunit F